MSRYGLILAGGTGERLWPLSRKNFPKQLLKIASDKTMLEETLERFDGVVEQDKIRIVTSSELKSEIQQRFPYLDDSFFIVEPVARNTGPAICYAAFKLFASDPEALLVVLSSDHRISPLKRFQMVLTRGINFIESHPEYISLIGISPTRPETGYGYIRCGSCRLDDRFCMDVEQFVEKPSLKHADEMIKSGLYLWNSGMFIFRAKLIVDILERLEPDMYENIKQALRKEDMDRAKKLFARCRWVSFDKAILEKYDRVVVVKGTFNWDDIGTFAAIERLYSALGEKAKRELSGNFLTIDSSDVTIINTDRKKFIVVAGIDDLLLVNTDDVIFVVGREKLGKMREYVERIKNEKGANKYL